MKCKSADIHSDWLRLVEPEGQFLTPPVLKRAFENGYESIGSQIRDEIRKRYPSKQHVTQTDWDAWITWLLRNALQWGSRYRTGNDTAAYAHIVPEHNVALQPDGALVDQDTNTARAFVTCFPHGTPLDKKLAGDRWNSSPIDRMTILCRAHGVRIGLVTDGERIVLVWAPPLGANGYGTWDTSLFTESKERPLLQSFVSLLRASRFFSVQEAAQIESLFEASEKLQNEVTGQLGFQIRQAVELLVNAISRANLESDGKLLAEIPPQRVYEAAATVMMRLVFLLYAEERELLPLNESVYADNYAISTLREQLEEQASLEGDEPLERRNAAWFRLLATFRVIYAGLNHDRIRLPAYGGRLFDPDRFSFLEGRTYKQHWSAAKSRPLPIDDLSVKAILDAIQTLPITENGSKERRKLSFRSLDVEQIGHVYEGLLDHGTDRINEVWVGLDGKGDEDEIALSQIEAAALKGKKQLIAFFVEKTKRGDKAIQDRLADAENLATGKDADMRRRLNEACDNDLALAARIAPYAYLLREDLRGLPLVFEAGSLIVRRTKARRDSGTEYTPRELAEEMVQYALEPLVYSPGPRDGVEPDKWKLRPSKDLLELKICDPAVGSGAFLVSACRYLADRLVEAWVTEDPQLKNASRDDLTLDARRAVVDRCLYGVDRDSMAVEMAKLSLWLITMARERPFSFLDHSIRDGDSLLGVTSIEQLLYLHIDPIAGKALHHESLFNITEVVKPLIERSAKLRRELEALPTFTVRDADEKRRLNDEANALLGIVNTIADGVIGAALSTAGESDDKRNRVFHDVASQIHGALDQKSEQKRLEALERLKQSTQTLLNAVRPDGSLPRQPLHWVLAFSEVFVRERAGFDCVIGNPPFVGFKFISLNNGSDYRKHIACDIANRKGGNTDLIAYFFLRAAMIASNFGFIAVNTISQGDTREVGLDDLLSKGWSIIRATRSRPWPGAAGISISQVWLSREADMQKPVLDGKIVSAVSSWLFPAQGADGNPRIVQANKNIAFQGSIALGTGFMLDEAEAQNLMKRNKHNKRVLFRYLSADDVCSRPDISPSRWVIYFYDWDLSRAEAYPDCLEIVRERVKPERDKNRDRSRREYWWRFTRPTVDLYEKLSALNAAITIPIVSKYTMPTKQPIGFVFSNSLVVVASDDDFIYGVLSSSIHRDWARRFGSTLETRARYTTVDCFETFPFPDKNGDVTNIMQTLHDMRATFMEENAIGITTLYNRLNDPGEANNTIEQLRELHSALDKAVCNAYGWKDIELECGFHNTDDGPRWGTSVSARAEILDRLLELNHERTGSANNVGSNTPPNGRAKRERKRTTVIPEQQMSLY